MDTSSLRELAFQKLQKARECGTELATATAARAASSISGSIPLSSSFVFRAQSSAEQQYEQEQPLLIEKKLESLKVSNDLLRSKLMDGTMDEILYKLDLINESLALSIENMQEGSHMISLLNRQLKDSAAMKCPSQIAFYRREEQITGIKL